MESLANVGIKKRLLANFGTSTLLCMGFVGFVFACVYSCTYVHVLTKLQTMVNKLHNYFRLFSNRSRGVFRNQSKIFNGAFCRKMLHHRYLAGFQKIYPRKSVILTLSKLCRICWYEFPQHKKWIFPLKISSVNVIKSASKIFKKHLWKSGILSKDAGRWKTSFFV